MIRPAAIVMAGAMAAVTTGTYYGLDLLPPGLLPPPIGRAPPETGQAPAARKPLEGVATATTPAPAEPAAAPAAEPEQALTEADIAEADPEPAAVAPQPAPSPAAAAAEPPPALVDEPVAPARPAAAPERPRPRTEDVASRAATTPAPVRKAPPDADVIKPWWPDSTKMPADQLKLQYAGQVQGERAIALLFSAPLDIASLRQHARVRTEGGEPVAGDWQLGKNPRLAVFRGVGPGRYTLILQPQIADTKGFMLGQTLTGPVYIQGN
jgi:hypothetical protein